MLFIIINLTLIFTIYRFFAQRKHIWSAIFYYYYWNSLTIFLLMLVIFESEDIGRFFTPWIWFWILGFFHILIFCYTVADYRLIRQYFKLQSKWWWWDTLYYIQCEHNFKRYYYKLQFTDFLGTPPLNKNWLNQQIHKPYLWIGRCYWIVCLLILIIFWKLVWDLDQFAYSYQWSFLGIILYGIYAPHLYPTFIYLPILLCIYIWWIWFATRIYIHIQEIFWPHGVIYIWRILETVDRTWMSGDIVGKCELHFEMFFQPRIRRIYQLPSTWRNWHQTITDASLPHRYALGLSGFYKFVQNLISDGPWPDLRDSPIKAFSTDFLVFSPTTYYQS